MSDRPDGIGVNAAVNASVLAIVTQNLFFLLAAHSERTENISCGETKLYQASSGQSTNSAGRNSGVQALNSAFSLRCAGTGRPPRRSGVMVELRPDADLRSGGGCDRLPPGTASRTAGAPRPVRRPRPGARAALPREEEQDSHRESERAKPARDRPRGTRLPPDRQCLGIGLQ